MGEAIVMVASVVAAGFPEFDLKAPKQSNVSLDAALESVVQDNPAMGDTVRAIRITFNMVDSSADYWFRAKCHDMFELDSAEQYADADAFLDENLEVACGEFYKISSQALYLVRR